ncbi:MAG: thioredoxin 1 [Patiriisocius sp.]|jgi:thioredoxin 1
MDIQLKQKDFKEAVENNKAILIDFYAEWCGPCKTLSPTIIKLAEEFEGDVLIKKVNVDENRELAQKFNVRSIPALVYIKDGEVVGRQNGLVSEQALRTQINQLKTA